MVSFTRERAQKIIYGGIAPTDDTNPLDFLSAAFAGAGTGTPPFSRPYILRFVATRLIADRSQIS
jgi:hypothetical protein